MTKTTSNTPKLRFPGFTDTWEQRKVSDVAEITAGGTPSTNVESYWEPKEIPWLSSGEVHKKYITFTDNKISIEGMNHSSARMVKENSVLIALAGQGKTRGTVAINRIPLTTNQSIAAMTFVESIVPEFVYSNLDSRYDEIRKMSSGDGARGGLNKQIVGDIIIPYTSKNEQEQIGHFFSNLDKIIALHQRKLDGMKEYKKGLLQKMFPKKGETVPEIRFPGFTDDWEQRKLSDVSEKICVGFVGTCEKYYTDESGIPMYRTGNLKGLTLNHDDMKYVTREFHEKNKKSQLRKGDILIARHGDNGKAVNYELSEEANCLNIVIIRPDTKQCNYRFLAECINSPTISNHIKSLSAGSTQSVVNTSEIEQLDIVIPRTIDEQNRIAEFITSLDDLITLHQRKLDAMKEYKKGLLQQMFV